MARCSAGLPTSRGKQRHSHLLGPRTPAYGEVTPLLHSSARAGPAGAAVPLCQVILVALVLRVEIIWLCFLFCSKGAKVLDAWRGAPPYRPPAATNNGPLICGAPGLQPGEGGQLLHCSARGGP